MKKSLLLLIFGALALTITAQKTPAKDWFLKDLTQDSVLGTSSDRAYNELLKGRKATTVVVAVIDSGVEDDHEDLKDVMWVNPGEIAGNGVDDDHNGYVDDIHGWNFIGGPNGNVDGDNLEVTRLYAQLRYKYEKADPSKLTKKQKKEYAKYLEYKTKVEDEIEKASKRLQQYKERKGQLVTMADQLEAFLAKENVSFDSLMRMDPTAHPELMAPLSILKQMKAGGMEVNNAAAFRKVLIGQLDRAIKYFQDKIDYHYNPDLDTRSIVGDHYDDLNERYYGNNEYEGPDAFHGTHVSGIIAANRHNNLGIRGVADNVRIMSVRTVPNGDERDKDVANAIRYAVDNGASVINMSFGKAYSPYKKAVDEAVKYAAKHDVLLIHAAGNDSENNDVTNNFPNDMYLHKKGICGWFQPKMAKNWIEVGALNYQMDENAVAPFSNYGKKNVDIFAPGMYIYSTIPENTYGNAQGTSMACPAVVGVAAALRSQFPTLTAEQVKEILLQSAYKPQHLMVKKPGTKELVDFSTLSVSGGIVNLYNAVKLAMKTKGKKKMPKA